MKQKKRKPQPEDVDNDLKSQLTLPRRDYTRMSERQLLRTGQRMYTGLQVLWRVELELPHPDWGILESVSCQLRLFEQRCPEVCEP